MGIWHETYLIRARDYENVYNNMPAYGMGLAGQLHEASGKRRSARSGSIKRRETIDLLCEGIRHDAECRIGRVAVQIKPLKSRAIALRVAAP